MAAHPEFTVPHLTTALSGPLYHLEAELLERQSTIEQWLRNQWRVTPAPFYASVDLRNAGFKLAPVDTNLFPAGFNNLSPAFQSLCINAVQSVMERVCPTAKKLLIVPESHTRNRYYLESVASLQEIIHNAGYDTRVGTLAEEITEATTQELPSGRSLTLEPLSRRGDRLGTDGFDPCAILLNNDLSGGRPAVLEGLSQPTLPPLEMGWTTRSKYGHFQAYEHVANEFAALLDIDPWLINPIFRNCGQVNFKDRTGEECLVHNVGAALEAIGAKYREYGIDRDPFVMVKADSGTYGMGVIGVSSVDEIRSLNRKQRNRMISTKDGLSVSRVLIQEGVYTEETFGDMAASAEPVVYMIDHYVVGGFYRVHATKGSNENLNSPGMEFRSLAFADSCINPDHRKDPDAEPNRFYAYGVIARLALLAAARELAAARV